MTILHVYVSAVLVFVGQSTPCVEWMIVDPPIIFGKTAQLLCSLVKPNISLNTHNATGWLGGKDYSILTFNGITSDPRKYAEIRRWHRNKFESILQIFKFDEMDVNVIYSCSIGSCRNRKRLSLTPDKFEYHPDKDTTRVLTHFRYGYLDVIVKIIKVYPIPECTIMFNENIISRGLTSKTSVNGIFYMVVEEVEQRYFNVCSGQLIVTCVVGKTEMPTQQKTFNRCTSLTETKEESTMIISYLIITILPLIAILVLGMVCCVKYGQFKKVWLFWREDQRTLERHAKERISQLIIEDKSGSTHDAGQEESHDMISLSPRDSDNDSLLTTTDIAEHNVTSILHVDN